MGKGREARGERDRKNFILTPFRFLLPIANSLSPNFFHFYLFTLIVAGGLFQQLPRHCRSDRWLEWEDHFASAQTSIPSWNSWSGNVHNNEFL